MSASPQLTSPKLASSRLSVTALPSFDAETLDPTQSLNRLQQLIGFLDNSLRLPNSPRAFMTFLLGLIIVFAGAFVHVLMAAQIMQAEFMLVQLQEEYRAIEQQNGDLIFQIARDSNINRLQERVMAQGYVQAEERKYVFVESQSLANAADTAPLAVNRQEVPSASAVTRATTAGNNINSTGNVSADVTSGQLAQWEEFWRMTWLSPPATSASTSQISNAAPAAWSTWWEQTTEQGSKLLDQFRSER